MGVPQTSQHPCALGEGLIHGLADGELGDAAGDDGDVATDIRGHIAACAGCRGRWDAVIGVRRLLVAATRRQDHAPMPPDLLAWLGDFAQFPAAVGAGDTDDTDEARAPGP